MDEKKTSKRLSSLEEHLMQENPLLVDAVGSFRKLDKVAQRLGLLSAEQSYASQIAWWPLVSILGPFSAGKSSFINYYAGFPVQNTGSHAVDDKFTVICYTADNTARVLPGLALDADLRFPFYKMSEELDKVCAGEGGRVDAYLQLKTCPSERLKGLILIDSPGFDADAQRTSTLRITNYIMDLSDLVLVLFDARRPEPGAMRDTLFHLVQNTISRKDSTKFMYILNQMDIAAREDNPEEVVGAWQRALAQHGLTAGKFYRIYNPDQAVEIPDEALRKRFEAKRDQDMAEIHNRMGQVRVERAYRIVGALEKLAREIEEERVPQIRDMLARWSKGVLRRDAAVFGGALAVLAGLWLATGYPKDGVFVPAWVSWLFSSVATAVPTLAVLAGLCGWLHFSMRKWSARNVIKRLRKTFDAGPLRESLERAFRKNTAPLRSVFSGEPAGWSKKTRRGLEDVIVDAERYVQSLNDRYAHPSGVARKDDA